VETLDPGSLIFREGSRPIHLHVLLSGLVELTKMKGEKDCGLMIIPAGEVFMAAAALFDEPYLASARVLAPSRILLLDLPAIRETAVRHPPFALGISRLLAGQWRMALRDILDLKCRTATKRLAAFLLKLVEQSPSNDAADLPFAKRTLAARVGMTAETLSRSLQILAGHGLVVRGRRILVRDPERIAAFCGADPYPSRNDSLDVHLM
jgi:CRP/FNR family transcriptional activator FtrB